jgi:hypothetical protein
MDFHGNYCRAATSLLTAGSLFRSTVPFRVSRNEVQVTSHDYQYSETSQGLLSLA